MRMSRKKGMATVQPDIGLRQFVARVEQIGQATFIEHIAKRALGRLLIAAKEQQTRQT